MKLERATSFLLRNDFIYLNDRIIKDYGLNSVNITEFRNERKNITVQIVYQISDDRTTEVRNFNVIGINGKKFNGISVMNFPRLYNNNEFDFLGV